jgi:hypothetical protein
MRTGRTVRIAWRRLHLGMEAAMDWDLWICTFDLRILVGR